MEILVILLVALIGLVVFDVAAVEVGVDSRTGWDDPHAPLYGSH
jgi:hypothetical protein